MKVVELLIVWPFEARFLTLHHVGLRGESPSNLMQELDKACNGAPMHHFLGVPYHTVYSSMPEVRVKCL